VLDEHAAKIKTKKVPALKCMARTLVQTKVRTN
jgi:hypothetical protein